MDTVLPWVKYAAKAVYAGAITLIGGVGTALIPDSAGVSEVTTPEKWAIAGLVVAAVGGVFGLQNGDRPGTENEQPEAKEDL